MSCLFDNGALVAKFVRIEVFVGSAYSYHNLPECLVRRVRGDLRYTSGKLIHIAVQLQTVQQLLDHQEIKLLRSYTGCKMKFEPLVNVFV